MNRLQGAVLLDPNKRKADPLEGFTGPCIVVNEFAILDSGSGEVRLHFAERIMDGQREFRCAVNLGPEDFQRFVETINDVHAKLIAMQDNEAPQQRGN